MENHHSPSSVLMKLFQAFWKIWVHQIMYFQWSELKKLWERLVCAADKFIVSYWLDVWGESAGINICLIKITHSFSNNLSVFSMAFVLFGVSISRGHLFLRDIWTLQRGIWWGSVLHAMHRLDQMVITALPIFNNRLTWLNYSLVPSHLGTNHYCSHVVQEEGSKLVRK